MFVNVFLGSLDRHLNDAHLLQGILSRLEKDQVQAQNEASQIVTKLIRILPTRGLPFDRNDIF
ncbi:hypothetical protein N7512_003894 [Penicillium capsulatum]|nr:hypothetical protein N7512_003894 [Penicillium capsulatum]